MATIGSLVVDLRANSAKFNSNLDKASGNLNSFERKARKSANKVQSAFREIGGSIKGLTAPIFSLQGAFATLAGSAGLGLLVKSSVQSAAKMQDFATTVGVSVEELQKFRYAADQAAGVVSDTADMAFQRFVRRVGDAHRGMGELVPVFEELGIRVHDADGRFRSVTDILFDFANKVSKVENQSLRLSYAMKAFDSEGAKLVAMLGNGAAGMRELYQEAQTLGVVTNEAAARAAELDDKFAQLAFSIKNKVTQAVLENGAALEALVTFFADSIPVIAQWGQTIARALGHEPNLQTFDEIQERIAELNRSIESYEFIAGEGLGDRIAAPLRFVNKALYDVMGGTERYKEQLEELARLQAQLAGGRYVLKNPFARAPGAPDAPTFNGGGGGGGSTDTPTAPGATKADPFADAVSRIREQVAANQALQQSLGMTEGSIARVTEKASIMNALKEADITLTKAQKATLNGLLMELQLSTDAMNAERQAMEQRNALLEEGRQITEATLPPIEQYRRELEHLNEIWNAGGFTLEAYHRAIKATREQILGSSQEIKLHAMTMEDATLNAARSMEYAFTDLIAGTASVEDAFGRMVQSILADMARLAVQRAIIGPLFQAMGLGNPYALPGRAGGGRLSGGSAYMVGEHGPEMFVPDNGGRMYSHSAVDRASAAHSGGVSGGINMQVYSPTSKEVERLSAGLQSLGYRVEQVDKSIEPRATNAVKLKSARGPVRRW